jgi:N-acyl-D-aspartate/D-glutamate deacylase
MSALAYLFLCAFLPPADPTIEADYVLRGATLHDGTGGPGVKGDLAIKGERIVAIGAFQVAGKPRILDGSGLIAAPGFIDLHVHSDTALTKPGTRDNLCYLLQGVTTVVNGNCGFGPYKIAEQFRTLEQNGIGSNVIHLMPHNDLREAVMKNSNRPPSAEELRQMEELVDQGMKDGAWGLSTGLIYIPGTYARTDEVVALAKVAARHGGLYASHIRDEGAGLLDATEEALAIGREAKLHVHISHMKASGHKHWGKSADQIALVEKARRAGQSVSADQYPYIATSTDMASLIVPARFREGSHKDFLARLDDPELGPQVRKGIAELIEDRKAGEALRIAWYPPKPAWQGKNLDAIAREVKKSVLDVVLEIERQGGAAVVNFALSEEDVRLIMKRPWVATASDGSARQPSAGGMPHPRAFGCFPRKIGRYAIQDEIITLEHALRSSSGLPADILKLPERGYLKKDFYADVVVFDPKTFRDQATFDKPMQYATGVRYLFVNGKLVLSEGKYNGMLAGKVLRHKSTAEK